MVDLQYEKCSGHCKGWVGDPSQVCQGFVSKLLTEEKYYVLMLL